MPHIISKTVYYGSSPLSRGTLWSRTTRQPKSRFIPALAGNTSTTACGTPPRAVHPRSRGEHPCTGRSEVIRLRFIPALAGNTPLGVSRQPRLAGSSPLSRGTHLRPPRGPGVCRFIPALAGNTALLVSGSLQWAVHPRSRGEHSSMRHLVRKNGGSSPLSRGTLDGGLNEIPQFRFIPALAGNTRSRPCTCRAWTVHPRSRGEHRYGDSRVEGVVGSSPLSRGTQRRGGVLVVQLRFIPALAGNTSGSAWSRYRQPVHPRSRGEHASAGSSASTRYGSSPLSRGTRGHCGVDHRPDRFIPALAGNTPRILATVIVGGGSSPLSRGTRFCGFGVSAQHRFIPALAGNTPPVPPDYSSHTVHPRSRGEHAVSSVTPA